MAAPALVALAHGSRDPRSAADDQGPRRRGQGRCAPTSASRRRSSTSPSRPSTRSSTGWSRPASTRSSSCRCCSPRPTTPRSTSPRRSRPPCARHQGLQDPGLADPRHGGGLPRGARRPPARGAQGGPGPRARRPRPRCGRIVRRPGQPGRRAPRPHLGHPPQAAGHGCVRVGRSAGRRRGRPRLPGRGHAATSRSRRSSWRRASCRTGPPSWPSRPARSPCPSRWGPTRRWRAPCWRATPSARWSSFLSSRQPRCLLASRRDSPLSRSAWVRR